MSDRLAKSFIDSLNILIVDGNQYMRKITRTMLVNVGAKQFAEAGDGLAALEAIRTRDPDVMVTDWDMPILSGTEVIRIVRSPGVFPRPNLPIIMLTNRAERHFVNEAVRAGVHEFLVKPTSPKALLDRLIAIAFKPRAMVQLGKYYVPEPRRLPPRDLPQHNAFAQMRGRHALQAAA